MTASIRLRGGKQLRPLLFENKSLNKCPSQIENIKQESVRLLIIIHYKIG